MYVRKLKSDWLKKITLSVSALLFLSGVLWAQNITVTGKVTDSSGEGIPGIFVQIDGTRSGTTTLNNGNYSITIPSNGRLSFSSIGYKTQLVDVAGRTVINVVMEEDATMLQDVVVVGYGSQKRENLTGAVASVNVERTLASRPIADVGRGLQGSVPGLSVVVRSGEIGSDPSMRIRGQVASIEGNANPLILLDNIEIPSIQLVNPDDIESISVLKDAASSSIYGAKAAFGVILITTKKGAKRESVSVTYSNNFSWQNRSKELNMAGIDGMQYAWDAASTRNPEALPGSITSAGNFWRISPESIEKAKQWQQKYGNTVKPYDPFVYGRDWTFDGTSYKYGYRTFDPINALVDSWTPTQSHNISLNGLSGKTGYSIGIGMLNQSGMNKPAKIDDFKRYNASVNVSTEVNKYISVRGGAIYSDRTKRYPSVGSVNAGDPWLYAYRWGPTMPIGVVDQFGRDLRGPYYEFSNTTTSSLRNIYTNVNLGTTINVTKDWDIKFDYTHVTQEDIDIRSIPTFEAMDVWYSPSLWTDGDGNQVYVNDNGDIVSEGGMRAYRFVPVAYPANGTNTSFYQRESRTTNSNSYNLYSTYNLQLGDLHAFKFMAGMNIDAKNDEMHRARRSDLTNFDNPQFDFSTGTQEVWGDSRWESQVGFFGRINYVLNNKYLFEGNLRYGGSSKFPKHLKWQYFPSFSAGWILSEEKFMNGIQNIVSFAKIRASWGQLGDQSVSNSLYVPVINGYTSNWLGSDGLLALSFRSPDIVQSDIKWQVIETLNLGIDARFFHNKLGVTFDWFTRDTKDMIISGDALPMTLGSAAPRGNFGNLQTKGFELVFDFVHRFSNGIGINVMAQLSDAVTRITKGADWATPWEDRSTSSSWATGARYGDIWGYVTDRLYQESDFVRDPATGKLQKVTIIINGSAKDSYMLSGPNPVYQTYFEDGGGVVIFRPGDVKFVDLNGDGYITPGRSTFGDPGDQKVIGNTTPRYEYGIRLGADYKGFDLSVFVQGVGSRQMWGSGQLAIPGYNVADGSTPQAFAGDYWKPDRTDAFYPRPWDNGGGDSNYSLRTQTRYLLNMAYTRIKNITLGYSVPEHLLNKFLLKKARVYVSLENFFTFDHLRGLPIDPEVVSGYSMFNASASNNANLSRTGQGTPAFKSVSAGIQIGF